MNQLAMNSPEMSECDILHTLRWSSRLRISSYVNWIKVPQWDTKLAAMGQSEPGVCAYGNFKLKIIKTVDTVC